MSGYLTKIKTKIPYTDKEVDINVDGKTLILTGGNGCGKTQLLSFINQKLTDRVIDKNNNAIEEVLNLIRIYEERIRANGPAHKDYDYWVNSLEKNKKKKKELENPEFSFYNIDDFVIRYQNLQAVLLQFEAIRQSDILKPSSVASIDSLRDKDRETVSNRNQKNTTTSSVFEEFLLTSKANQAFSESEKINNNPQEAARIDKWFNKLESDLQNLFEDDELKLVFREFPKLCVTAYNPLTGE